jgi:outer membrane immunogenic protein
MPGLFRRVTRGAIALAVAVVASEAQAATWSGWYAGIHGDYAFGRPQIDLNHTDLTAPGANFNLATVAPEISFTWKGWMGGGQIGHNWHSGANLVLGFELGASAGKIGGSKTVITNVPGYAQFTNSVASKTDYVATLRLRGGLLLHPNFLVYATAGGAGGRVRHTRETTFGGTIGPAGWAAQTRFGLALGGGAEVAIGSQARLRAEYLHIDLADSNFATVYPSSGARIAATARNTLDLLTAGLSFAY